MTRSLRPALIAIAGASVLAAAGCASRGAPVPDIAALHPYTGEWVLQTAEGAAGRLQFASRDGYGFRRVTSQTIGALLGIRAERFLLEVNASTFQVSSDEPRFSFALPINSTPVEAPAVDGDVQQLMTLTWEEGAPVVRREISGAGWVSERFELTADGTLVVTRKAAMINARGGVVDGEGGVEFHYIRDTGSTP